MIVGFRILVVFSLFIAAPGIALTQPKEEVSVAPFMETPLNNWKKTTISTPGRPSLDVYVSLTSAERRPILLMIQGSKCVPLFRKENGKLRSPLFITDAKFFQDKRVHAIALERRGIRSFEAIPKEIASLDMRLRCSDSYGGLTKETRIEEAAHAINALSREPWFGDLIVVGHSEGVDIAAGLARRIAETQGSVRVSALGLLSGASPSLLFDRVVEARKNADLEALKGALDDMFFLTGEKVEGKFGGYPVKKMLSYAVASGPLADTLKSSARLFVANGTLDQKASVEGADLLVLEVLRSQPKRSVMYYNYTRLDHDFLDTKEVDYSLGVFSRFVDWGLSSKTERGFEVTGTPENPKSQE
jgi:pimeloyl-ACP methyl ester carboxylesterase